MNGYKFNHQLFTSMDYSRYLEQDDARLWCQQVFGEEYTDRWGYFIDGFNFNDEKDYAWFLLRWS